MGENMKTERNILTAFILNLSFSVFELFGGLFTGSVAIISDSVHDMGDAVSIGLSYFLEKKSKKEPDEEYTYGYARYSVLGGVITTLILLFGSAAVIYNAVIRIASPAEINYNGMILFALLGATVNSIAAFMTREGDSLNQKAVNLHMLEDVLGWIIVLVGAIVMKFTDFTLIDPVMSIGVAVFILINAVRNLNEALSLFLEKVPHGIRVSELVSHLSDIDGIIDVHHVHIRSIDGHNHYATMHVVTDSDNAVIKSIIRDELREHGIAHATIEIESTEEICSCKHCHIETPEHRHSHSHHHH